MPPDLISEITKILKESHEFVLAQAPDTIQQYLGYQLSFEIGSFIGFFIILILSIFGVRIAIKNNWDDVPPTISGACGFVGIIICTIGLVCSSVGVYQIKNYPKGFLLDKLAPHSYASKTFQRNVLLKSTLSKTALRRIQDPSQFLDCTPYTRRPLD